MKRYIVLVCTVVLCSVSLGIAKAETAVDMDLTAFNRGITYAQMIQVCNAPESYDGKTFRVKGIFNYSESKGTARIIFSDSTGCCELAMMFIPAQPLEYPDDYPPLYSDIVITAKLAVDSSNPEMPCRFADAEIEW